MTMTRPRLESRSKGVLALLAALASLGAACSKAPAEAALKAADESVTVARRDGENFAPEAFNDQAQAAKAAHAQFDRGEYAAAKVSAQHVVADAQDIIKAAAAKKEEARKAWTELEARVPPMRDAIRAKVHGFAATNRPPKGISAAHRQEATNGLAALEQDWTEANEAAKAGDLMVALGKGRAASARAQQLKEALGLDTPAEPLPNPRPPAGK